MQIEDMKATAMLPLIVSLLPALVICECPHLAKQRRALGLPQDIITPDEFPPGFPGSKGWIKCATEHSKGLDGLCYCEGTVIYGNKNGFTSPRQLEGCVECSNHKFPNGNQIGGRKQCFCKATKLLGLHDGIKYESCRPWITVGNEWENVKCNGEVKKCVWDNQRGKDTRMEAPLA